MVLDGLMKGFTSEQIKALMGSQDGMGVEKVLIAILAELRAIRIETQCKDIDIGPAWELAEKLSSEILDD